ncbi:uncharacterized protein LOC129550999 [Moschus berezovskii]|uniref:uncharacterized protein LOC129550999 n=1 Tax=Moschus berezovskii TaxID=68408 RepID=UPI002444D137|nr:uncharacterized protein LOC129550999 [Moschus berezovskii]
MSLSLVLDWQAFKLKMPLLLLTGHGCGPELGSPAHFPPRTVGRGWDAAQPGISFPRSKVKFQDQNRSPSGGHCYSFLAASGTSQWTGKTEKYGFYPRSKSRQTENLLLCPLCGVHFFATPWTAAVTPWIPACQASLSFTVSQSLFKLMSIESMMPSNRLIFDCPLLLLPSIFPSIRVFSSESALHIRWPKSWDFTCIIHLVFTKTT